MLVFAEDVPEKEDKEALEKDETVEEDTLLLIIEDDPEILLFCVSCELPVSILSFDDEEID